MSPGLSKTMVLRRFVFSCDIFGYWETTLDVSLADTLDTLTQRAIVELGAFLQEHKLSWMLDKLKQRRSQYHIHSTTLQRLTQEDFEDPIYVCSCSPPVAL